VAGDAWQASDIQNIDRALAAAMTEPPLNNVMAQYFTGVPTSRFVASQKLPRPVPAHISQGDVEQLVVFSAVVRLSHLVPDITPAILQPTN
jgi:hypothetical protein